MLPPKSAICIVLSIACTCALVSICYINFHCTTGQVDNKVGKYTWQGKWKKWWKQIKADLKYQIIISQCSGSNPHMSICKLETPKSRSWLYIHIHHSTLASRVSSVRLGQLASPSVSHARLQLLRSQRIGLDWIGSDRNGSPWIDVENAQLVAHTSILMQPGHGWRLINIATR